MGGSSGDFLFGKPAGEQQQSASGNYAWDVLKPALTPAVNYLTQGGSLLGSMLGVGGAEAQTGALENFANSGGMKFLQEQGMKGITSSKAASGLLGSGSFGTALSKYNQGLASTYLNQYMQNLMGYSNLGLGAANALTGAGGWSKASGEKSAGKEGALPMGIQAASMIPGISDRRLKTDIVEVGSYPDGLKKYTYKFKEGYGLPSGTFEGVMADEVKTLRPHAFIPNLYKGYDGVDYARLNN